MIDDEFQMNVGMFLVVEARRLKSFLEKVCGSPIEIELGYHLATTIVGMGGQCDLVFADEECESCEGFYLYPQKTIGKYRVDFLFGRKGTQPVIIECDGREFHHSTREQIERDRERDQWLSQQGYKVLRFPGTQIHNDPWKVCSECIDEIARDFTDRWLREYARFLR